MKAYGGPSTKGQAGRRKSKVSETRTRCLRVDRKTERQNVRKLTRKEVRDLVGFAAAINQALGRGHP